MLGSIASDLPYHRLAAGYRARRPDEAASAYHADAQYVEAYPGQPEHVITGRANLARFFAGLFDQLIDPASEGSLDLSFRFVARRGQQSPEALRATTARAQTRPAIRDWLFPERVEPGPKAEWYDVLRSDFDPLPVWQAYRGPALFIFGSLDNSTPTAHAVERLRPAPAGTQRACLVLDGAQHLGVLADDRCRANLDQVAAFHPAFFSALVDWVATLPS